MQVTDVLCSGFISIVGPFHLTYAKEDECFCQRIVKFTHLKVVILSDFTLAETYNYTTTSSNGLAAGNGFQDKIE